MEADASVERDPHANLPVLLTEAALREESAYLPAETLLDMCVELRPVGFADEKLGNEASAESLARKAYNARCKGETDKALR
jgi:hypothetical protein